MEFNKSPIILQEGKIFIDGVQCADSLKAKITFSPDVWTGKTLGDRTPSARWTGGKITVTITQWRSTKLLKNMVQTYLDSGETPEMTIQGIMDDKGSDYYKKNGSDTITCVGCVPTNELDLMELDTSGSVKEDTITCNAKKIV